MAPCPYTGILRSRKHQIILPVSAYLIEHPRARVLIDTGWHRDVRTDAAGHLGRMHLLVNKPILPEGASIDERLEALGLCPRDLDYVVLTHLHDDHASGLGMLTEAKRIVTSDIEYREAMASPLLYRHSLWEGTPLETFAFDKELPDALGYGLVHRYHDLLGDGSILLINTSGHTLGMCSVLVRGGQESLLLCADTTYSLRAVREQLLPGITADKCLAEQSLRWLKYFDEDPQCVGVIPNHATELSEETYTLE